MGTVYPHGTAGTPHGYSEYASRVPMIFLTGTEDTQVAYSNGPDIKIMKFFKKYIKKVETQAIWLKFRPFVLRQIYSCS